MIDATRRSPKVSWYGVVKVIAGSLSLNQIVVKFVPPYLLALRRQVAVCLFLHPQVQLLSEHRLLVVPGLT